MKCSDYKNLGNYYNIMMPTKKEQLTPLIGSMPPPEMYTGDNAKQAKINNESFSTQYMQNYKYGVDKK